MKINRFHVGFTGTRDGMTDAQQKSLRDVLLNIEKDVLAKFQRRSVRFHHGCCVGSDRTAHLVVNEILPKWGIIGHPPTQRGLIATGLSYVHLEEPLPYLDRDRVMAKIVDVMVACPQTSKPELRSGTWATVRYAIEETKPVLIIQPDGVWRERI